MAYTPLGGVEGILDFGFPTNSEGDTATVTLPAPWVRENTKTFCWVTPESTPDHDGEDAIVEGILCTAINVIPGVSLDVEAYAPQGTWGKYVVYAVGLG